MPTLPDSSMWTDDDTMCPWCGEDLGVDPGSRQYDTVISAHAGECRVFQEEQGLTDSLQ